MFKFAVCLVLLSGILFPMTAASQSIEDRFIKAGLVDIHSIEQSIQVNLVNSAPHKNVFGEDFYSGLNKAYLRKNVALKLAKAQKILQQKRMAYSLLILDAARPRSVSRAMYEKMKGTQFEKYVANPSKGSMHNYGIAVDISIVNEHGVELDMGLTPFNKSTFEIYLQYFKKKIGFKLSQKQKDNRKLLSDVMLAAGFYPLRHEWWHFNGMKKHKARQLYNIIE